MAKFEDAIDTVLQNEGGYVNDPNDPGGETNYGISKRTYPHVDIKNLTLEDAKAIYRRDFWKFDGVVSQPVATKLFDAYVNMGHQAIKLAQRLVDVAEDGWYGGNTEHAINEMEPSKFLTYYRQYLVNYYVNLATQRPALAKFLNGWLKRARE